MILSPRRLRIAVPPDLCTLSTTTGVGRIWVRTIAALGPIADVRSRDPARGGRRGRPDVWLAESSHEAFAVDRPVVTMVHEAAWGDPQLRAMLDPAFLAALEDRTARAVHAAAAVLTNSASTRTQVIDTYGGAPERVHVAYPGVDHGVFYPRPTGLPAIVAAHGGTGPYVMFAASIHPRKNLAALRAAIAGLARRGFPHQLVVVPAPAYDRDSAALEVELLGPIPGAAGRMVRLPFPLTETELAEVMAGAAVFCLPSFMEGLGIPVLEAMACGAPPVVSDRGALPELVAGTGVVVPPEADALEEALAALLADEPKRAALGEAAHRRAAAFTWASTARVWLGACTQAVGASSPPVH